MNTKGRAERMKPLTLDEAKKLVYGQTLYERYYSNADGTPRRWRVNGAVKTWKRNANRVEVPIKRGLYEYDRLDESNLHYVSLTDGQE